MSYKPSEDLKKYLSEVDIISYRLVDGTYLIAEECDRDVENNILYLAGALQLEFDDNTQ